MADAICGYLKIGSLKGESQDSKHEDWIDVLAFSWGMENPTNPHSGSGSGASLARVHAFSITKQVDASSVKLTQFLLKGAHFDKATFELPKAGGDGKAMIYYKVDFEEVVVSSMNFGGGGGPGVFTENITFTFGKFKAEYNKQNAKGAAEKVDSLGWDCKKNQEV